MPEIDSEFYPNELVIYVHTGEVVIVVGPIGRRNVKDPRYRIRRTNGKEIDALKSALKRKHSNV